MDLQQQRVGMIGLVAATEYIADGDHFPHTLLCIPMRPHIQCTVVTPLLQCDSNDVKNDVLSNHMISCNRRCAPHTGATEGDISPVAPL